MYNWRNLSMVDKAKIVGIISVAILIRTKISMFSFILSGMIKRTHLRVESKSAKFRLAVLRMMIL